MRKIIAAFLLFPSMISYAQIKNNETMESIISKVNSDRVFFDGLGKIYPPDTTVVISKELLAGVDCYWFVPKNKVSNEVVIYLHGGSFALGSLQSHKALVTHFASSLKKSIVFVDYALAPENPYPKGVNDIYSVYSAILNKFAKSKIYLIGDSAGGGLAVSSIEEILSKGLKLPDAVILISPWLDLACDNPSYVKRRSLDPILTREVLQQYASYYTPENLKQADPSQLKFTTFPPAFILVGSNEILFDDAKNFYESIKPIQTKTWMKEYENQNHVWLLTDINSQASQMALMEINEFLEKIAQR